MDRWLTTAEVAHALGLHRTTVLRLVEAGRLEASVYRYGPRATIRIRESSVDAFLARWRDEPDDDFTDRR